MSRFIILRAAAAALAAASLQAAPVTAAAEEISIPGDQVAEALEQLFSGAQVRLHSANSTPRSVAGGQSFHDPNGSYLRFGGQLGNRRHPILTAESGVSVSLDSSDNGGGNHNYYVNLNDVNSTRVDVEARDDNFRMTFTLEPDDPEVAVGCVHLIDGSRRSCPATATAGPDRNPQVNWNQPAEWTAARMRITLEPILHSGSVALRATNVELTGDVDPPAAMGCTSANMVPRDLCFIIDNFIDRMQNKVLNNQRFPHGIAAMSLDKTVQFAFDDAQVKNLIALNIVPELTRANVADRIWAVRMEDGDLVIDGQRRRPPAGAQVPAPPGINPRRVPQDFNPNP